MDTSVAHPAQGRDDKVTVSRSSPRSRARGCDPNGSLRAVHANVNVRSPGGRSVARSPQLSATRYLLHARGDEGRSERRTKELARKEEKRPEGRRWTRSRLFRPPFSPDSPFVLFLASPYTSLPFSNSLNYYYLLAEVKRSSPLYYGLY